MEALAGEGFTHVIIDNQPLVGSVQTLQATTAANDMIVTLHPDSATLQGFVNLIEGLKEARQFNPKLKIDGILLGKYKGTNNERFFIEEIKKWADSLGIRMYRSIIREGIAVQEAQGNVVSLWDGYARENPAIDLANFIGEYMEGST